MELQSLNCGVYAECLQDYRAKHSNQSWGMSGGNFQGKKMEGTEWPSGELQVHFLGPSVPKIEEIPQLADSLRISTHGGSPCGVKASRFHL